VDLDLNNLKLKQDLLNLQRRCENAKGRLEEAFAARTKLERKINEMNFNIEAKKKHIDARRGEIEKLRQDYERQRESLLLPLLKQIEELTRENQAKNVEAESRQINQNHWEQSYNEYLAADEEVKQLQTGSQAIERALPLFGETELKQFLDRGNPRFPFKGSQAEKIAWIARFAEVLKHM